MPLDLTKDHTIHGAGAGRDVILQTEDGVLKLYDRSGAELPFDPAVIQSKGIALTDAFRIQVEESKALQRAARMEAKLALIQQKAKEKALAQAEAGELPDWSDDADNDDEYADLLADFEG